MKIQTSYGLMTVESAKVANIAISLDTQSVTLTVWFFVENGTTPIWEENITIPYEQASEAAKNLYSGVEMLANGWLSGYIANLAALYA